MVKQQECLVEIGRDECIELLKMQEVGRIAVTVPGDAPLVVPVNFIVDGDAIVFRSDLGTKVRLLRIGPVSFQVDFVDSYHRTGWSVLAKGIAYEATHREIAHLPVNPWAGGGKSHWVRLVITDITGRRIQPGDVGWPYSDLGYI